MALASNVGVELEASSHAHAHGFMFGEDQGRYLVATDQPERVIAAVTGGRVIDTWRQDRQPLWDNVEPVADAEIKALARLLTERERMRRDRLIGCTA
jgi:phosphoribosylformylglycinamidine (FGAM) synthase-like enzyme